MRDVGLGFREGSRDEGLGLAHRCIGLLKQALVFIKYFEYSLKNQVTVSYSL